MGINRYIRQSSILNIDDANENNIMIIGCGAIGSFTAISLAKMGLKTFHLVDYDKVEDHNLPNQFFKETNIGEYKTEALAKNMREFNSDIAISYVSMPFTEKMLFGSSFSTEIVICCVDKMDIRKKVFNACKKDKRVQLFIDGRMGGLQAQLYTIDMENKKQIKYYESTLFSDESSVHLRCTERSIIFTVLGISSLICNQIVMAFNNKELKTFITLDYILPQMIV